MANKIEPEGMPPRDPARGPIPSAPDKAGHPAGHEPDDLNVRAILWFMASLVGGAVVLWLVLIGFWHYLDEAVKPESKLSPWAGLRQLPPEPRLQVQPNIDLQAY